MKLTRRQFLTYTGATGLGALTVDGLFIEPRLVEFTHHEIGRPDAPQERRIRFAQLSDLHLTGVSGMHREIADHLGGLDLDFLLITGDAVDSNYRLAELDEFLGLFDARLPKYAILGNWEHWGHVTIEALRDLYENRGGTLLINETKELRFAGERFLLTGLDDYVGGVPSIELALHDIPPAPDHIILSHCPSFRDYLMDYTRFVTRDTSRVNPAIDFDSYRVGHILSGHTHGGQVSIAGIRPFMPKGSGEYVQGWYRERRPHLYVSRGIGTSIIPVRIGARPEVAVFTMGLGG